MTGDKRGAAIDVGRPGQNRLLLSKVALCSTGPRKLTLATGSSFIQIQLHARPSSCYTALIPCLQCVMGKVA